MQKHKVHKLFVFGSILTNRFNDKSDVDLVVDFNKKEVEDYFDNYFDFKYSLEEFIGQRNRLIGRTNHQKSIFEKRMWMPLKTFNFMDDLTKENTYKIF